MKDWLLFIGYSIHDSVWVWFRDVVLWKFQEKKFRKLMAKHGMFFDKKGNLI